ncbi:hypothetical protein D3C87_912590 [compost metagenome]
MLALFKQFKAYLVGVGAALAFALGAYLRGRSAGKGAQCWQGGGARAAGRTSKRTGRAGPQGGA